MDVLKYNPSNLSKELSNKHTDVEMVKTKNHFSYFKNYLGVDGLNAKTMVIEEEYVSKDFLHDYASYYAFCFTHYHKFCRRIHFFSRAFTLEDLNKAIVGENHRLWNSYLGFIVVNPIPITMIGYTVLKTYSAGKKKDLRKYWGLRDYKIHLFGKVLTINSLAFQEQDNVLAACATTAIWSMLNKASVDLHTTLKVPSEITKDADRLQNDGNRLFPNKGLGTLQICQAINNSGLAPEVRTGVVEVDKHKEEGDYFISNTYLKKIINAYELIGIPIILAIKVPYKGAYGYHAVAVCGHKIADKGHALYDIGPYVANRIEKIYIHDDQFGPFARAPFIEPNGLETQWTLNDKDKLPSYVMNMVVPVYPKIRISYEDVEAIIIGLHRILIRAFKEEFKDPLFWDIKLNYSHCFKAQVLGFALEEKEKLDIVSGSLPKYIWIATCYVGEDKFMELTFDATDVSNAMLGKNVICYFDTDVKSYLKSYLIDNKLGLRKIFKDRSGENYLDFMINNL